MRGRAGIADLVLRSRIILLLTGKSPTTLRRGGLTPLSLFDVFADKRGLRSVVKYQQSPALCQLTETPSLIRC
jgi:hypothetical protein